MKMILNEDLEYVWNALSIEEKGKLTNSTILLTGCGGFLGQFYLAFFEKYAEQLDLVKIIGIDTFTKQDIVNYLEGNGIYKVYASMYLFVFAFTFLKVSLRIYHSSLSSR